MKEYNLQEGNGSNLPAKVSVWSKVKGFLFQEIDLNKPIVLELTPREEKVLGEVHNFLFQEVKFTELHDFLFQEIDLSPVHDFLFQEVNVKDFLFQEVTFGKGKKTAK